jgi:hypothetical protein
MECAMYRSEHCEDCLVTALVHPPSGVVELDDDIDPSLAALSGAGLIPALRFRPRGERSPDPPGRAREREAG